MTQHVLPVDYDYLSEGPEFSEEIDGDYFSPSDLEFEEAVWRWEDKLSVPVAPGLVKPYATGVFKISAIKIARERMNIGLKDAKTYVEKLVGDEQLNLV